MEAILATIPKPKASYVRHSPAHMLRLVEGRQKKRREKAVEALKAEQQAADQKLRKVATLAPSLAKTCGISRSATRTPLSGLTDDALTTRLNQCFLSDSAINGVDARFLKTFCTDLELELQKKVTPQD